MKATPGKGLWQMGKSVRSTEPHPTTGKQETVGTELSNPHTKAPSTTCCLQTKVIRQTGTASPSI